MAYHVTYVERNGTVRGRAVDPSEATRQALESELAARGSIVLAGHAYTLTSLTITIDPGPDGARTIDVELEPHGRLPAQEISDVPDLVRLDQWPAAAETHIGPA